MDDDDPLRFFQFAHLPMHLQEVSQRFCELANYITIMLPDTRQRQLALDHLLTAKDCAVRAKL